MRLSTPSALRVAGASGIPGPVARFRRFSYARLAIPSEVSITRLLGEVRAARPGAMDELIAELYAELHARARAQMRGQGAAHTLQPSALVNEAFLRLFREQGAQYSDREHFLAAASKAMRHVLVDHARGKRTLKRDGGHRVDLPLDQVLAHFEEGHDLDRLDRALTAFEAHDPLMAAAVEQRFFGGATNAELAGAQGKPLRTFERHLRAALAWLHRHMEAGPGAHGGREGGGA